jgi:phenylacetate-CoA ligase
MNPFIANMAFRVQERLLARPSFRILRALRESQYWPQERMDASRLNSLQLLLRSAYDNTLYWRELMNEIGLAPQDIRSLVDIQRIPLLNKNTIRARREEMVWKAEGRRVMRVRTSGSTNDALEFYTSSTREASITAARMRGHEWVGVQPGDRELYFWASPIEVTAQTRIKRLRDWLVNNPFSDAVAITRESVPRNLEKWRHWRPRCIFSYPSSVSLFARFSRSLGLDLKILRDLGLRAIVTTAEVLSQPDRELISESFGVPVRDSYGLREAGLIGHECSEGTMHTNDELLILETIDPLTGRNTDGEGELVVTNLSSRVMPIIRYRTNDMVKLSTALCPCGRSLHSIRVTGGRLHDFVVTSDGKWISSVAFLYMCKAIPGVLELQVRQDRSGEIRILVVPEANPPEGLVPRIVAAARARVGDLDRIDVELVSQIAPVASNKYRIVVSKVAQEMLAKIQE